MKMRACRLCSVQGVIAAGVVALLLSACASTLTSAANNGANATPQAGWQTDFHLENRKLSDVGEAKYFVLKPGFQLTLKSATSILYVTVLDETKVLGGISTRVVEEREQVNGQLAEIARNYFAIDPATGDAFYFGEEVDYYKDGKVSGHAGSWVAYENGNKPGMVMPGTPQVGVKYYQELAPGVAMDRAEITSVTDTYKTPAGDFKDIVVTRESSQIDPAIERKTYAPGIGLVQDEDMKLTSYGYVSAPAKKGDPIPDSLTAIEAQAEDIIDLVPQSAWANVQADVATIETAWKDFQKQADDATFDKALAALKAAATAKDALATLQAANDVSAGVIEMMTQYDSAVPADIGRLDVAIRQVIFDTAKKDSAAAKRNFAHVQALWNEVKPAVLTHDCKKVAEQFEQNLAQQSHALEANDSAALTREAKAGLEIVDALEKVFTH